MSPMRFLVLLTCLALGACERVSQDDFARLQAGMSRAEVEQLLGRPDECSAALAFSDCTWGDAQRYIRVQFAADRVVLFSARGLR